MRQVHQRPVVQHITAKRRRGITSCPWQSQAQRDTATLRITTWTDGEIAVKRERDAQEGRWGGGMGVRSLTL